MHLGVDQTGGPDDLLDDPVGVLQLARAGCGRHEQALVDPLEPFVEPQRPVVGSRRQPEPVLDQGRLAAAIALVLAVQLWDGHVATRRCTIRKSSGKKSMQRDGRLAR